MRFEFWLALLSSAPLAACNFGSLDPTHVEWDPPSAPAMERPLIPREECVQQEPLRQAFFGDLHVHTGYSMDAYAGGAHTTPADAYRYARGDEVEVGPLVRGRGRRLRIDRPLDFAAVTDHAEFMGELGLCSDPDSPVYDHVDCQTYRGERDSWLPWLFGFRGRAFRYIALAGLWGRNENLCGEDATRCRKELLSRWELTQKAAEDFYDRSSACEFTTFVAWEYSRSPDRTKIHRNVILRNEIAPELPVSWIDEPDPEGLWRKLRDRCNDTGSGCDAIAIPHNPNLSNGQMFTVVDPDAPLEEQRALARLRAATEPIVEMVQVKGESECQNGMYGVSGGADELCDFEKIQTLRRVPFEDCETGSGWGAQSGRGCQSRLDFVRYALIEGLRQEQRLGVNPYEFGFIGSTDNHVGTPGAVEERGFFGSNGRASTAEARLDEMGGNASRALVRSPGGLAGAWAEENTRDSIFDAFARRETFATSGPRIRPRFFGGWGFRADLCDDSDRVETAYRTGVPMGGRLESRPATSASPVFVASALRDPGTTDAPGGLLQRIQIVKGWPGEGDEMHQAVYDVAGGPNDATVDLATCQPRGAGAEALCAVWRDPDFDPDVPAVYYARVVENPSCRWSTWQCLEFPEEERPPGCGDPGYPKTIQERAWTSPIFYAPPGGRAHAGP